jgi:putative FmdB family regulatory protein
MVEAGIEAEGIGDHRVISPRAGRAVAWRIAARILLSSAAAMPIYEYRCEEGHLFEVMQRITDDPVTTCIECGAPVQRVFHPVAVHFKGSGFYNTDYGTARRKRETESAAKEGAGSGDAKKAEKKTESGSSSSSAPD